MKKPRRGGKKSSGDKKEPSLSLIKIFWCFPLLVLAVYLSPRYPFPSFVPERLRHCCRLWGIYKEGCWQIKVTGRDGGVLNIRSTSHRSRPSPTDSRGYIQQQTIKKKKKKELTQMCWREKPGGVRTNTHMVLWQADPGWMGFGQQMQKKDKRGTIDDCW